MSGSNFFQNLFSFFSQQKSAVRFDKRRTGRFETLEDRNMMSATMPGEPAEIELPAELMIDEPMDFRAAELPGESDSLLEVAPVTVRGINIRINGQDGFVQANETLKLNAGDFLEVTSVDVSVNDSLKNQEGVFALEGYVNKIRTPHQASTTDYGDGRFSARDDNPQVALGDLSLPGLDDGWKVENGWDRLTLNLMHYFGDSSQSEATISLNLQVGTPDFAFDSNFEDLANATINVGEEVNIFGSWINQGAGLFHNYAEVDIFHEDDETPSWVGVLVGNSDSENPVSGEFLFPTENGDFAERWTPEKSGTYYVQFSVEPEGLWSESNESNNQIRLKINVGETLEKHEVGDLNGGVVSQDRAEGTGFIMYSKENVHERFRANRIHGGNSDHMVTVRFHDGAWQYDTNYKYVNFEPRESDILIAKVDFTNDTGEVLEGDVHTYNGMQHGVRASDLKITPNIWRGRANQGEFLVEGSYLVSGQSGMEIDFSNHSFSTSEENKPGAVIGKLEVAGAKGGLEFEIVSGNEEQLFCVDHQGVVSLNHAVNHESKAEHQLLVQVSSADSKALANVTIVVEDSLQDGEVTLGDPGKGVVSRDHAKGTGFIMLSHESINDRFADSPVHPGAAEKLVTVLFSEGKWYYDTNYKLVEFQPEPTDLLVARVNFSANKVDLLEGVNREYKGISAGYQGGDLNIEADYWDGRRNHGEFKVTGNFIKLNSEVVG